MLLDAIGKSIHIVQDLERSFTQQCVSRALRLLRCCSGDVAGSYKKERLFALYALARGRQEAVAVQDRAVPQLGRDGAVPLRCQVPVCALACGAACCRPAPQVQDGAVQDLLGPRRMPLRPPLLLRAHTGRAPEHAAHVAAHPVARPPLSARIHACQLAKGTACITQANSYESFDSKMQSPRVFHL